MHLTRVLMSAVCLLAMSLPALAAGQTLVIAPVEMPEMSGTPGPLPAPPVPAMAEADLGLDSAVNAREVLEHLELTLAPAQREFLEANKFLLVPIEQTRFGGNARWEDFDEMLGVVDAMGVDSMEEIIRHPYNTRFINADVMLHGLHRHLEILLEYLEMHELGPELKDFMDMMTEHAFTAMGQAEPQLAERLERVVAQLSVARILLANGYWPEDEYGPWEDPGGAEYGLENALAILSAYASAFSPETVAAMEQELAMIYGARDVAPSPLWSFYAPDTVQDYTQYTPRSHYAKRSSLRAYFRAMMYLGRNGYPLNTTLGMGDSLVAAGLMGAAQGPDATAVERWQRVMAVTGFFAGESDDITYAQLGEYLARHVPGDMAMDRAAVDETVLAGLVAAVGELPAPRINSSLSTAGSDATLEEKLEADRQFRIFGQRFSFDAFILNRMSNGDGLPTTPTSLFVPAVLGNGEALGLVQGLYAVTADGPATPGTDADGSVVGEYFKNLAPGQDTSEPGTGQPVANAVAREMELLAGDMAALEDADWYTSLSAAWLKLLTTMGAEYGEGYPRYMQSAMFPRKQLEGVLGSYTELKHDTLLYAKQSFAEMGGPEDDPSLPMPRGFVEPNMAFWYELSRFVDYIHDGLVTLEMGESVLTDWGSLSHLRDQIRFFTSIAERELTGEPISDQEYDDLRFSGLGYLAMPLDPGAVLDDEDKRAALVADIHTDGAIGQVLYEATGRPYVMLALVGDGGMPRLVTGVAFNHYEFTLPLGGERMTDQAWQALVYENPGDLPPKPSWFRELLPQ